jgi:hypothetical protein
MAFKNTGIPVPAQIVSIKASDLTDSLILAAPGEEKTHVILSVSSTSTGSLATSSTVDATTRLLYLRDGAQSFPLGWTAGINKGLYTDVTGANYITIHYYTKTT